jgi:RimJ/RimL family protein N-acetyltransferase/putative flippase GtrA
MNSSPSPAPNPVKRVFAQGLRFLTVGALNTLGTLALYQLLLFILPYEIAYALAWAAGLLFVNVAYPRFVYGKSAVTLRDTLQNSGYYVLSFAASWALLRLFTATLDIPPRLSVFWVLAVIVPLNFLVTRYIYRTVSTPGPCFVRPKQVIGNRLAFRDAAVSDAAFILALRTDAKNARYLSTTSHDLQQQVAWLETYVRDPSQIYFLIEDRDGNPVGTVRLYDQQGDSFCWGSWIIKEGCPGTYAIESALMVYHFARMLGFRRAHFNVRKGNESVWRFHKSFGAQPAGETDEDFLFTLSAEAMSAALGKYARYLTDGIAVRY